MIVTARMPPLEFVLIFFFYLINTYDPGTEYVFQSLNIVNSIPD